jgi:hypothetical protein
MKKAPTSDREDALTESSGNWKDILSGYYARQEVLESAGEALGEREILPLPGDMAFVRDETMNRYPFSQEEGLTDFASLVVEEVRALSRFGPVAFIYLQDECIELRLHSITYFQTMVWQRGELLHVEPRDRTCIEKLLPGKMFDKTLHLVGARPGQGETTFQASGLGELVKSIG